MKKNTYAVDDKFFENEEFQLAIEGFAEMRKKKRAPLTEYALKLILKKLHSLSDEKVERAVLILEQSIENGWQGVFELHEENKSALSEITKKRTEA